MGMHNQWSVIISIVLVKPNTCFRMLQEPLLKRGEEEVEKRRRKSRRKWVFNYYWEAELVFLGQEANCVLVSNMYLTFDPEALPILIIQVHSQRRFKNGQKVLHLDRPWEEGVFTFFIFNIGICCLYKCSKWLYASKGNFTIPSSGFLWSSCFSPTCSRRQFMSTTHQNKCMCWRNQMI